MHAWTVVKPYKAWHGAWGPGEPRLYMELEVGARKEPETGQRCHGHDRTPKFSDREWDRDCEGGVGCLPYMIN